MRLIIMIAVFSIVFSCKTEKKSDFDRLVGEWKMENLDTYEVWKKEDGVLEGFSYKLLDGEKIITEELKIEIVGDDAFYIAKVYDQNEGKPIRYKMNKTYTDRWMFENLGHDFPKRIIYHMVQDHHINIRLEGSPGHFLTNKLIRL